MRIALDVSAVPASPAGAGRYIVELARRLASDELSLTLSSRRHDQERWRSISPRSHVAGIVPDRTALRLLYEAYALGRSETARVVDVWHGPHYTMPRRASRPSVVTVHDMTFFTHPEWHERAKVVFFRRAVRYASAHASALVAVSEFTARELREHCPSDLPVIVAPHGVDLDRFTPNAGETDEFVTGLPDTSRPYVLFVGTLEPRKGVDTLLDAFENVAADDGELELWIAGQSGWGVDATIARIDHHPYASRIRRLGFVADSALPGLLRRARAVAYPSLGEGFGLPVLEALASATPVVTTASTVMAEVAGETAWLVPAGDAVALGDALSVMVNLSDSDRDVVGRRGRRRAEHFTWENSIERHLEAYRVALEHGS